MSKNPELDALIERHSRLCDEFERLIAKRARAMDAALPDEFDELRRRVDAYFSGVRSPVVDRKLGAALGNHARAVDAAETPDQIYARRRQELREGRR